MTQTFRAANGNRRMRTLAFLMTCCAPLLILSSSPPLGAEEIFFQNGKRLMAMIEAIEPDGKILIRLPGGQMTAAHLTQVSSIAFRGRENQAVRAGAQEFHFVSGDRLMGQIVQMRNDILVAETAAVGNIPVPLAALRGFLTMPIEGKAGRRATELVAGDDEDATGKMDQILDRRTSGYEGVIEAIDARELHLDHERLRKVVPLSILHLAGVRLARDAQNLPPPLPTQPFVKVRTRDGSALDGVVASARFGKWNLHPRWQPERTLSVAVDEIVGVEVLNGQAIYLSQLTPVDVKEQTILTPRQRFRFNLNSQGNPLSVAGAVHPWGLGVHANSSLTFEIGGGWTTFESLIGIDDQAGKGGSVVFQVLGDGKEIYKSPIVRGTSGAAAVSVSIKGVRRLTLVVDATDDLDLGDLADWAGARLLRNAD